MMKEFTILTECELAKVDGGYTPKNCTMAVGSGMLSGAIRGGMSGTVFGVGTGNLTGAFAGAHIGFSSRWIGLYRRTFR
ncbi:bacteriocin class II family protein [Ligilactobacillus salivarius]|uniref:bacteriocin class II family protein n=1 Tax=Ligilactobacillus salivarius TaxID=1624 RepID=UPI001CBD694E|nr:bacteriocin class II family protein [Ligilactobacillus salivarius]MBZ4025777.1 bacteriocin class II family protein [Ligilactobacillus salivarius]MBZ4032378.1 bacteriocin class II family protein [Ligilactobacillus salivarius]